MEKHLQELWRGTIVLAVLMGFEVQEGTLYPLLRRLETQDLVASRWELGENRPRRYYLLSQAGEKALVELIDEWKSLADVIDQLTKE